MISLFRKKVKLGRAQLETPAPIARVSRREPTIGVDIVAQAAKRYKAALIDDVTYSFEGSNTPINEKLRHGLRRMRARARELCEDNDFGRRFISLVKSNVIGREGIKLQCQARSDSGDFDRLDNQAIEQAWREWGRPHHCTIDNKLSWLDVQNLAIASVARDGEVLIHMIETPGRDYGLRLRVIPAEYLDEFHNGDLPNGNRVVMGIEYDDVGRVVAYHVRKNRVRSWINIYPEMDYIRLPGEDVIHLHLSDYAEQARGVPWVHSAIRRLHLAGKYEEAELFAAYAGACKMGAYYEDEVDSIQPGELYTDDEGGDNDPGDGELVEQFEPGIMQKLPKGTRVEWFDPTHPTTAFDGFMRAVLRGASSGLNVAYHGLANDLENVNFSSIRAGVLEERDQWRALQGWLVEHMHERIYDRWLPGVILAGRLALPMRKVATKYQARRWQPRGWPWVDPKKDAEANIMNIEAGLETRQNVLAQQGRDYVEVIEQLAEEQRIAAELGVDIAAVNKATTAEVEINEN